MKSKTINETALVNAKYAMSRSLALLLVTMGLFVFMSKPYLIAMSAVIIGIQLFDGIVGIKISRFKTFGPPLTAVGNAVVLVIFLLKTAFESIEVLDKKDLSQKDNIELVVRKCMGLTMECVKAHIFVVTQTREQAMERGLDLICSQ